MISVILGPFFPHQTRKWQSKKEIDGLPDLSILGGKSETRLVYKDTMRLVYNHPAYHTFDLNQYTSFTAKSGNLLSRLLFYCENGYPILGRRKYSHTFCHLSSAYVYAPGLPSHVWDFINSYMYLWKAWLLLSKFNAVSLISYMLRVLHDYEIGWSLN
jgi:hypothetical protein